MKERFGWIDSLRGIAMIAIVMCHPMRTPAMFGALLYSFHVPLFFILSGVLLRPEKYQSLGDYLIHQIKKILIPYLVLYTCDIAFWYVNWKVIAQSPSSTKMVLAGVYTANPENIPMSNGALWFLPVLLLTSIAGFCLVRRIKKRFFGIVTLASLLMGFAFLHFIPDPLPWTVNVVPVATFFYLCGYLLMPYGKKLSESAKRMDRAHRICLMGGYCGINIRFPFGLAFVSAVK